MHGALIVPCIFNIKIMAKGRIFADRVFKYTKIKPSKAILEASGLDKEMRKEINRVFQIANRRLQNIEQSGMISTAAAALTWETDADALAKFAKFSTREKDLAGIIREYTKAVNFLNNPTSTATGARQYTEHLSRKFDVNEKTLPLNEFAAKVKAEIGGGDGMQKFVEKNTVPTDLIERVLQNFKAEYKDVAEQMERDAAALGDAAQIENAALDEWIGTNDSAAQILESFTKFKM